MHTHKALSSWAHSGVDSHLQTAYQYYGHLKSYMQATSQDFSGTMRIIYIMAECQHIYLSTRGVAMSATALDYERLQKAFADRGAAVRGEVEAQGVEGAASSPLSRACNCRGALRSLFTDNDGFVREGAAGKLAAARKCREVGRRVH